MGNFQQPGALLGGLANLGQGGVQAAYYYVDGNGNVLQAPQPPAPVLAPRRPDFDIDNPLHVIERREEITMFIRRGGIVDGPIVDESAQLNHALGVMNEVRRAAEAEREAAEEAQEMSGIKAANPFRMGADPEFAVVKQPEGQIWNVSRILPHNGPVGYDHGGNLAEIRPRASRSVYKLVQNIRDLLLKHESLEPLRSGYKWRSGGVVPHRGRPNDHELLGGHVHFGLDYGRPDQADIVGCLDELTRLYEHLDILPQAESAKRRSLRWMGNRGDYYGAFGNVNSSKGHLEYRTPASWLFKPEVAYLVLAGYKLAALQPKLAGALKAAYGGLRPKGTLLSLFEDASDKDDDARRIVEKFTSETGRLALSRIQGDPDADIKSTWSTLDF